MIASLSIHLARKVASPKARAEEKAEKAMSQAPKHQATSQQHPQDHAGTHLSLLVLIFLWVNVTIRIVSFHIQYK